VAENNDYLDLRDAIEVPWDELRSERTLKKILAASAEQGAEDETLDADESPRRPWLLVAAAALVIGSAGATAAVMQSDDASRDAAPVVAEAAPAKPEAAGAEPARVEAPALEAKSVPTKRLLDTPEGGSLLAFADGAQAQLSNDARVRVLNDDAKEVRIGQEGGEVVYKIDPVAAKQRDVVVEVAHLYIMVQGSHFSAGLTENKVSIEVSEGSVIVDDGNKQLELVEGDSLRLERQARLDEAQVESKPARKAKAVHADSSKRKASKGAGDLAASAAALQQLVDGEAEGKVPPVTWMTLGRVERRRGNHQAAAKAFESYWKRFSSRPLAEDALHEAFVSWRAAGRTSEAQRVAEKYIEAFPGGLHADQMATYLP
jgi:hypothetical protein